MSSETSVVASVGIIFSATFLLRALARIGKPVTVGSDPYSHLFFARVFRKSGHRIPDRLDTVLTGGYFAYPPLLPFILSFLPERIIERVLEPFWGAILDAVQSVVIYFAALAIFREYLFLQDPYRGASLAALIFASTPILVRGTAAAFFVSARPLGNFLFTCSSVFGLLYLWEGELGWLAVMLPFLTLAVLSSKFTVQNIVLVATLALLIYGRWEFLAVFILAEVMAIILTGGKHLRVIRHHLSHLWLYATRLQFKHEMLQRRKSLIERIRLITLARGKEALPGITKSGRSRVKGLAEFISRLVIETPELLGVTHTPMLLVVAAVLARDPSFLAMQAYRTLAIWCGGGILLFILTSLPYLRFLGEPDRYLGYIVFPSSVLASYHVVQGEITPLLFIAVISYSILVILVQIHIYRMSNHRRYDSDPTADLAAQLQKTSASRILCIPTILAKELMYRCDSHRYLCFAGANLGSTNGSIEEFDFIFSKTYPFPRFDLDALVVRYDIRKLVVEKRRPELVEYDLSSWQTLYDNEIYTLYDHVEPELAAANTS